LKRASVQYNHKVDLAICAPEDSTIPLIAAGIALARILKL
jgi:hypothetical protein